MRVAITGGIAEGKSTVLGYLADMGYKTETADRLAKSVFASEPVQQFLHSQLGSGDPALVRSRLSADSDFRRRLNALTHPAIALAIFESDAEFVEVPLLIETCMHRWFPQVWVVTCGMEEQIRRLVHRLGNLDLALEMASAQVPTAAKIPFADTVVRTNCSEESVRAYVIEAVREIP